MFMKYLGKVYYKIQSFCVSRYRLPNHVYYGEGTFTGDSVGLGLGQRLNFISKKTYFKVLLGKNRP